MFSTSLHLFVSTSILRDTPLHRHPPQTAHSWGLQQPAGRGCGGRPRILWFRSNKGPKPPNLSTVLSQRDQSSDLQNEAQRKGQRRPRLFLFCIQGNQGSLGRVAARRKLENGRRRSSDPRNNGNEGTLEVQPLNREPLF